MFDSRIPLPSNPDEAAIQAETKARWLPRAAGHCGLKFSNGLEMAHNEASRALDAYADDRPLRAEYVAHDGAKIVTDECLDPKTIRKFLANPKPKKAAWWLLRGPLPSSPGQGGLRFSNGFTVSHSDESRALAKYARDVETGKIDINMTAVFTGPNGAKVDGIQAKPAKTLRLLSKAG